MEEERKKKELEDIELNKIKEEQKRKEHEEFMKK